MKRWIAHRASARGPAWENMGFGARGQGGEDAGWRMDLGEQICALRRVKMLASKAGDR